MSSEWVTPQKCHTLDDAQQRLGISRTALWIGYLAVGGNGSLTDVESWVSGRDLLSRREYDLLAQSLNEEFLVRGLDHPVPYSDSGAP
jgi:hypothetical protein